MPWGSPRPSSPDYLTTTTATVAPYGPGEIEYTSAPAVREERAQPATRTWASWRLLAAHIVWHAAALLNTIASTIRRNFTTLAEEQALAVAEEIVHDLEIEGVRIEALPPVRRQAPAGRR